jgi:hypothetical protein
MYALVTIEGGQVTGEYSVSAFRLMRLLVKERPDILAVDSIQEIAVDQHSLFQILQAFPPGTKLVQVTGGERKETLGKVAARYNLSFDRFDPFDEARTIARVAALGAGVEVIAFEDTCEVVVSRHRSPGKGGWSQNRYVRRIHGAVQQKAREVEMAIVAAGLRYQKKETRAFGGFSRVAFKVVAPRDDIPVPTYRGADTQVRIIGKRRERLCYRPLSGRPKFLIIGIDPGTTTAIAALDLEGNLVHLSSSRQMTMAQVTEVLFSLGKPLIIASDVAEMPYSVEKVRRAFHAVGFSPRQDLPVESKTGLAAAYPCTNDHERDALAAALEAHRSLKNKFQNLPRRVPPGVDLDEVRAGVIRGLSVEQVLGEIAGPVPTSGKAEPGALPPQAGDERVRVLDGAVKRLREYVRELQEAAGEKDREVQRLQARIRRIRSAKEAELMKDVDVVRRDAQILSLKQSVHNLERANRTLRKRIERMKAIDRVQMDTEAVPLKVLGTLTKEALRTLIVETGIKEGDLVYVHRTDGWGRSVIKDLAEAGVRGIIVRDAARTGDADPLLLEVCHEAGLPLLPDSDIGVLIRGKYGIAPLERVQQAMAGWNEEHNRVEMDKKSALLETIFLEYRSERGKEMRKGG